MDNPKKKKRFKGLIMVIVVSAALLLLISFYTKPILQKLWGMFPSMGKMPVFSKILKEKGVQAPEGQLPGAQGEGAAAGAEQENKIVPVVVYKVAKSDFEDILPAMGTIKGLIETELRFESNGVVESVNFKEGDLVKKGDIVAMLNQQDFLLKLEYSQSKLKTAQTQMLTAKKKLEIHQKLYEVGSIIKSKLEEVALEYENAKSQVTSAEKEVEFAKQEVQKAYLVSPIDGIMGTRDAEAGEFVTSTTKIATIIDISSVYAEVGIIEKDMQKVALGQEATVTVDAYPNTEFKGTIDNVLPVIEGKSRTITCKIKIENSSGQLLPGMFARATIFVFGQKDAIVVPNTCLKDKDNDGNFDSLFVVSQDNVASLRDVQVGYLTSDNVVINSGLEDGELVVTEARAELQDGAKVEVLETQEGIKPVEQPAEGGGAEEKEVIMN